MKEKFFLFTGIIISIFSVILLIFYDHMETRMKGFHANDNLAWILLIIGVGMISYFIGRNKKIHDL